MRYGIFKPVVAAILVALVSVHALRYDEVKWIWIAADIGMGIAWLFGISHLLGMCSRFDQTGQLRGPASAAQAAFPG